MKKNFYFYSFIHPFIICNNKLIIYYYIIHSFPFCFLKYT